LDDPDAGAALRSDLALGATATAGGIDYAGTLTALRGAIAAQTAPLPAAASSSGGMSLGAKVVVGVLVASGIAVWAGRGRDDDAQTPAVARAQLEPASVSSPEPVPEESSPAPVVTKAAPIVVPEPPIAATPVEPTADATPDARIDRAKPSDAKKRRDAAERTTPSADTPTEAPTTDTDRYVREAKLVAQARRALADDPTRALALTRQVEREFPNGMLEEERRALEIRALAALGRADEAQSAAKGFLAKFPDGPHAAAVRRAIED
jgi:hypothetical protein